MSKKPRFGRIYQRTKDGVWWIAYYDGRNKEYRESSKSTKYGDAERLLKTRHAQCLAGRILSTDRTIVAELLDDLLADYETNGKSIKWARYVDLHLRPFFGHQRANEVGTRAIQEYIKQRRTEGIKNSTINRELSLLRRAYNLALRAEPPKVASTPRINKLAEHNVRKGFLTHEEYRALHAALPEHVKPILAFAYHTGTRRGEILNLKWSQVDLAHNIVRLEPGETKNKDARVIPLTTELITTLKALHEQHHRPQTGLVFTRNGKPIKRFDGAWTNACKTAGLTDDNGKPTKIFHDLRRTGVRNLIRAGVPELVAMKISGHRTRSVFDRYNIVNELDLHAAATALSQYLNQKKTTNVDS